LWWSFTFFSAFASAAAAGTKGVIFYDKNFCSFISRAADGWLPKKYMDTTTARTPTEPVVFGPKHTTQPSIY
jgi:hypothetical protein